MSNSERQLDPGRSALDRFGYELRGWRKARGLSQAGLGALVHVSGDLLHKIELAQRWPSWSLAEECDRVLDTGGALVSAWPGGRPRDADKPVVAAGDTPRPVAEWFASETIARSAVPLQGLPERRTRMR